MSAVDDIAEKIRLEPDAGLVKSLGASHSLNSAIADLIDNSIDAGASRVSIRLLTERGRLVQIELVDDGAGMDRAGIDAAMTLGRHRDYSPGDLGHFGLGLKAAALGQSEMLTVWSQRSGAEPVGRRIRRSDFARDFTCEVLTDEAAVRASDSRAALTERRVGTTVVLSDVRNTYKGGSDDDARSWLDKRADALRAHLGVTFHRLIARGRVAIDVLCDEKAAALSEPGIPVLPIDPFGYPASGHVEYPKKLLATSGDRAVELTCHIWTPKADLTGFRIGGRRGDALQGFYVYRNDRLLQMGGWADTATSSPARQLARVVLDDPAAIGSLVTMNPEKSGLKFEPAFHEAINRAEAADGTTFVTYLQDAEAIYTDANRRKRQRKPAIRPEKGFAPRVRKRIGAELSFLPGDPLQMKWRSMERGEFLDIDYAEKTVWINSLYRPLFAPGRGSLNDAPVLKSLLYLLAHDVFEGQHLGARDKDEISLWKSVLGAAAAEELHMRGE